MIRSDKKAGPSTAAGGLIHPLSVPVYRPAEGAGFCVDRRLLLGGKQSHKQEAQPILACRDER